MGQRRMIASPPVNAIVTADRSTTSTKHLSTFLVILCPSGDDRIRGLHDSVIHRRLVGHTLLECPDKRPGLEFFEMYQDRISISFCRSPRCQW